MIARAASFEPDEVARAVGGRLERGSGGPPRFLGVATDSRDPLEGRLYVALEGRRFDGHDFAAAAVAAGAAGLLVSEAGFRRMGGRSAIGSEVTVVQATDTLGALGDLARYHRRRLGTPVIALTGSNGKTSTKEMLAAILSVERGVLATEGNLNNLIGLPLTLLGLESGHDLCVAEMGMNALGEIARMVEIAEPAVGLVTNIGPAHIGELGSIENIALAKGEMYHGLDPEEGVAVVNLDDARVAGRARASGVRRKRTFGTDPGADVRVVTVLPLETGQRVHMVVDGEDLQVELSVLGRHNALNAAAAVAAATALESHRTSASAIVRGLAAAGGAQGRLTIRSIRNLTIIDDSYNANAASAVAAIETAAELARGRRLVAAFGEMLELGAFSEAAHREVGEALARAGFSVVGAFGEKAGPLAAAALGNARHEPEDFDALLTWLIEQIQDGDVVLVKGSRGSRMERVIARIEELG